MKKLLIVLAGLSLAAAIFAKDLTIGFIPMTMNNEYFVTMVNARQAGGPPRSAPS